MPKHFNLVDVVLPYGKTSALDQSPETRLRSMLREMRSGSRDDVLMSRIAELVPLVDARTVARSGARDGTACHPSPGGGRGALSSHTAGGRSL